MFWITRYKGVQLTSDVSPDTVDGDVVTFVNGSTYDIGTYKSTGPAQIDRLSNKDSRWVADGVQSTPAQPIVDIENLGAGQYMMSSHDGNKILSGHGKFSVNIGDPANRRGFQIGHGNTQVNHF